MTGAGAMDDARLRGWRAVELARAWIGTPYVHGASLQGCGADCLGLLRGVWRTIYGVEPEAPPVYAPSWSEADAAEPLWRGLSRHMAAVDPDIAAPGDVALLRMRSAGAAKHLGILAEDVAGAPTLIHAYSGRGVVESSLGAAWRRRIVAAFRLPGEDG